MNVFLPSVTFHFRPFSKVTFEPQRLVEKIVENNQSNKTLQVSEYCATLNKIAKVASFLSSPVFHLPLDLSALLFSGYRCIAAMSGPSMSIFDYIEVGFGSIGILISGVSLAYIFDGTLGKLSADCGNLADECEKVVLQIEDQVNANASSTPTIVCPPQIREDPKDQGIIQSIIYYINSVIRAIYQIFSYCFQKITGLCS